MDNGMVVRKRDSGFVGIIAVLVVAALAAIILAKSLQSSFSPVNVPAGAGTSTAENAIQAAERVKKILETQNHQLPLQ